MKKITQIEIGGRKFYFDNEALEALESYTARIKELYRDNGEELKVADVESRIAQMCHDKVGEKGIVDANIVEDAIKNIGIQVETPKQETHDTPPEEQPASEALKDHSNEPWHRAMLLGNKIFRDKHAGYLGGVLAGLAAYFGTNTALLRLLAVLLFIVESTGITFFIYIALWIIFPKATSIIDYTRMRRVSKKSDEESQKAAWKENYEHTVLELAHPTNNGCLPTLTRTAFYTLVALLGLPLCIVLLASIIVPLCFINIFAQGGFVGSIASLPFVMMFGGLILVVAIVLFTIIHYIFRKTRACKPMKRWGRITLIALLIASLLATGIGVHKTISHYGGYSNLEQIIETGIRDLSPLKKIVRSISLHGNYTQATGEHYNIHPVATTGDKVFASIWDNLQAYNLPFVIETLHNDKGEHNIYIYKHKGSVKDIEHKVASKECDARYTINSNTIHGNLFFVWDEKSNTLYIDEEYEKDFCGTRKSQYVQAQDNTNIGYTSEGDSINFGNAIELGLQPFNIFFYGTQRTPSLLIGGLEATPSSTYTRIKGLQQPVRATTIDQSGQKDTVNLETQISIDNNKVQDVKNGVKQMIDAADNIVKSTHNIIDIDYTVAE